MKLNLAKIRDLRGDESQGDVAKRAGMTQPVYSRHEGGKIPYKSLMFYRVEQLANGLGVDLSELFDFDMKEPVFASHTEPRRPKIREEDLKDLIYKVGKIDGKFEREIADLKLEINNVKKSIEELKVLMAALVGRNPSLAGSKQKTK